MREKKTALMNELRESEGSDNGRAGHITPRTTSFTRSTRDRDVTPISNGGAKKGMGVKEMEEVSSDNAIVIL